MKVFLIAKSVKQSYMNIVLKDTAYDDVMKLTIIPTK